MSKNIVFINNNENEIIYKEFYPKPASKYIPDWYKNTPSYINNEKKIINGQSPSTIKRCMPIFDAINFGYIIPIHVDISITHANEYVQNGTNVQVNKKIQYDIPSVSLIDFHPINQASLYPKSNQQSMIPKFMNPWIIKTPPGYSTFFTSPIHGESPFKIFEGIVDTDIYTEPINFPFLLNDDNFEGVISAGTPIVQAIPFKRDSWEMEIGHNKDLKNIRKNGTPVGKMFFDAYKKFIRQNKSYK